MGKNVLRRAVVGLLAIVLLATPLLGAPVLLAVALATIFSAMCLFCHHANLDTADARAGPSSRWLYSERRPKKSKKAAYYHTGGVGASRSCPMHVSSYQESPHLGMASKGMRATATHLAGTFRSLCRNPGRAGGSRSYLHVRESALGLSPG